MKITFHKLICAILLALVALPSFSQSVDDEMLTRQWSAFWITAPGASEHDYGVYYFRKIINLKGEAKDFPVFVSGDNRYKLYVNGKLASVGPARGDVHHWHYEQVDLAPYLKVGDNVLAAVVWNDGELRPKANKTLRTGFLMQGANGKSRIVNTNQSWKVIKCEAYKPIAINLPGTSYSLGPGEYVDMALTMPGWNDLDFDDSKWKKAEKIFKANPKDVIKFGGGTGWALIPSELPQMELKEEHTLKFPQNTIIPANTTRKLLLDNTVMTNAYFTILMSGGKGAEVKATYADAFWSKYPTLKGNRNEIKGKELRGPSDIVIADGSDNQNFTTLFWRSYRFVQLEIKTKDEPLTIKDVYGTFTGYPFELKAKFNIADGHKARSLQKEINDILETGWRTARLCAFETYMDCPQFEQLQYTGDTRLQGLISIFNTGDARLLKNAINDFDWSRLPEGMQQSRYPSNVEQIIPTYAIWYIGMLADYMDYVPDADFVKSKLPGARMILDYFSHYQQADGSLKNLPGWQFTDWVNVDMWNMGIRKGSDDGTSALMDLQLLYAYEEMQRIETTVGMPAMAEIYQQKADRLKATIQKKYWDESRGLYADRKEKDLFSQHANILAILTGVSAGEGLVPSRNGNLGAGSAQGTTLQDKRIAEKLLNDSTLAPASIYFKYYLHRALIKAGLGDDYLNWLGVWHENLRMGLTTWAETSDVAGSRSDCHAWGAHPNIEFYRTILGIDSDAPGFAKVRIEPHLGKLKNVSGEIPHPLGTISVQYQVKGSKLSATIILPEKLTGKFLWKGKEIPLNSGKNVLKME